MALDDLKSRLGDFAKDIALNLDSVLTEDGAPGLSAAQIAGVALASAYATRNRDVIAALESETATQLDATTIRAAKGAATIMAMNNVYYRFTHAVHDEELRKLPAKLRMNIIGNPGIAKLDFELMSLAVSAINGCGMCMESHTHEVVKAGLSKQGVQSAIRIAAVINAAGQAVSI
ncbi:MAG: carboxymuconolactone decarboxylase family protein [Alphaproteobacteria bacterium]|nr:carboxymuconolactone decarboxylase family protein [Alphaproteobacteria bacterium]